MYSTSREGQERRTKMIEEGTKSPATGYCKVRQALRKLGAAQRLQSSSKAQRCATVLTRHTLCTQRQGVGQEKRTRMIEEGTKSRATKSELRPVSREMLRGATEHCKLLLSFSTATLRLASAKPNRTWYNAALLFAEFCRTSEKVKKIAAPPSCRVLHLARIFTVLLFCQESNETENAA